MKGPLQYLLSSSLCQSLPLQPRAHCLFCFPCSFGARRSPGVDAEFTALLSHSSQLGVAPEKRRDLWWWRRLFFFSCLQRQPSSPAFNLTPCSLPEWKCKTNGRQTDGRIDSRYCMRGIVHTSSYSLKVDWLTVWLWEIVEDIYLFTYIYIFFFTI